MSCCLDFVWQVPVFKARINEDIGIMEKNMGTTMVYWGSIRIQGSFMEKKMETTIVYGGYMGI